MGYPSFSHPAGTPAGLPVFPAGLQKGVLFLFALFGKNPTMKQKKPKVFDLQDFRLI